MAKSDIITRAKIESDQWTRGMKGMQNDLDKFRNKSKGMTSDGMSMSKMFGSLGSVIGKVAGVVGVGAAALEAFNKTIKSSEVLVDAMGRATKEVNSVVDSFFASLATGDFSNFINGLDDVARHARDAYNAVDALGTLKMFQKPQTARVAADIAEQRAIIRNPNATVEQKKAAQARLDSLTKEMYNMSGDLQEYARDAFRNSIRSALVTQGAAGVSDAYIDEFVRKNLGSMQAFDAMKERLARWNSTIRQSMKATPQYATRNGRQVYTGMKYEDTDASRFYKSSAEYRLMLAASTLNEEKMAEAFGYLTEAENARATAANTAAGAYRMMAQNVAGHTPKGGKVNNVDTGPGIRGLDVDKIRARMMADIQNSVTAGRSSANSTISPMGIVLPEEFQAVDDVLAKMKEKQALYATTTAKIDELKQSLQYASDTERTFIQERINYTQNMADSIDPAAAKMKKLTDQAEALQGVASAAAAIGNAFSATGNKTMQAVGQMIGTFAGLISTYATLKSQALQAGVAQNGALPFPYNVVAIATTVAAIASAMATVSSFAQGGIVGGTNFRDGISARVSSGEMVINEADQRRLFDAIHSGNVGGGGGNSYISGEQIVTVVNAYGRRTGRGELIK